jgi:hypothetical protein
VSLIAGGGHNPIPAVAEAGMSAPSEWGKVLPLLRQRVEAEQHPRQQARSAQPPSRARQTARRKEPGCAP